MSAGSRNNEANLGRDKTIVQETGERKRRIRYDMYFCMSNTIQQVMDIRIAQEGTTEYPAIKTAFTDIRGDGHKEGLLVDRPHQSRRQSRDCFGYKNASRRNSRNSRRNGRYYGHLFFQQGGISLMYGNCRAQRSGCSKGFCLSDRTRSGFPEEHFRGWALRSGHHILVRVR